MTRPVPARGARRRPAGDRYVRNGPIVLKGPGWS